jgi:4-hydroxy-tetrahydrodipicolinate synthase
MGRTKKPVEGIVALMPTVYEKNYELDLEGIKENIKFAAEAGVHGVATNGSVGEFYQTSFEEFKKIVDVGVDAAGKVMYMAGCNWQNTPECIQRAKYAEDAGADTVMIVPPYYMGSPACPKDAIYEHYKAVHDATKEIQILVYNNPTLSKANVTPDLWGRLVKLDRIVATKESVTAVEQFSELIRRYGKRINVLAGYEAQMLPLMLCGGKGTIAIWALASPKAVLEFYDACVKAKTSSSALEKAVRMHMLFTEEAWRVNTTTAKEEFAWVSYFKGLNEVAGRKAGPPRLPYKTLPQDFRNKTKEWLERLEKAAK